MRTKDTYDNGELVTRERMELEPWYPEYQSLIEFSMGETDPDAIVSSCVNDYHKIFGQDPPPEKIKRWKKWAGLHAERSKIIDLLNIPHIPNKSTDILKRKLLKGKLRNGG
jgi:hypothetical protein